MENLLSEERIEIIKKIQEGLELSVEADDVVTYAIQQQGVNIIDDVCFKNTTEIELDNLKLQIDSDTELIEKFTVGIQRLRVGEEIHLRYLKVKLNGDYLASLTERITCNINFKVYFEGEEVVSVKKDIVALAYDQWPGLKYSPEILAAFSMPNHPVVLGLIQSASQFLDKWTGNPSLAGYQFNNPNRVKQMAAAAYAAIQQKNITYANPPSSFELLGQRIRLADAVLSQHMGTCIDMTLLYVACLEAMGLNPIMILMHGHIFAGVWLVDDSFSDTIIDDPSQLEKRMANGICELLVVECTAMNAGKSRDFDDAVKIAENNVSNYAIFSFAIDVKRARSMGVRPLPVRIMTDAGFVIEHKEREDGDVTTAPKNIGDMFDLSHIDEKHETTKQQQWEHKLLDLSLRNMLINMRFTKTVVPLLCSNICLLEDALTDGEEFQVLSRPDNMIVSEDGVVVEALTNLGTFNEYIELESGHKKLHSFYKERELKASLIKIYRSAKTSLEENGASTLYLALGLLRWTEDKKSGVMRYAPIILMPIDITRKAAGNGYSMRMRDEDAQINITLLEFLKQNYGIQINGLSPLPTDEHGLDLPLIFAIIRKSIMSLPMWDVLETGFIGNFSFSQFVMWNDIHKHKNILERNDLVRSLIKGAIDWDCKMPEKVDKDEAYLPITVDASQLRAINMAANNVSFVLHGPPGTGKSQTITAMIVNALAKGKTVLFVAEKMAALEVVQKRLENLGIGDFCLELHSNKATKKSVLDQLRKNLELGVYGFKTDYNQKINDIRQMRMDIDAYVKKLYEVRAFGKNLKEMIDIYETIPDYGVELRFTAEYARTLTQSDLDMQRRMIEQLVAAGKAVGHPHGHSLSLIRQTVYTQTLKMDLEDTILNYRESLLNLKKAVGVFESLFGISSPITEIDWTNVKLYADSMISLEVVPDMLLKSDNLDREFDVLLSFVSCRDAFTNKKNTMLQKWKESFLQADMNIYRNKYDAANKKVFGKGRALNNLVVEIQNFASFDVEVSQMPIIFTDIEIYQKELEAYEAKKNQLPFEWRQIIDKYPLKQDLLVYINHVKKLLESVKQFSDNICQLKNNGKLSEGIESARNVLESYKVEEEKEHMVVNLLQLSFKNTESDWFGKRLELCDYLMKNVYVIKDWITYRQHDEVCRKAGLDIVCDAYENGLPHEHVMDVYLKSIYKAIILSVIESEPVLNSFTGNSFNEQIVQFRKLDKEFMNLSKREIYYILTHNLPSSYDDVETSKELNILRRAISSNGRGLSIRNLFDQVQNILRKLTPCMLMSPISVSQYLDVNNQPFDIVIFDEASQLPTCKAVGALVRGKNAVIVGDPNQMPPTSFFAGNTIDEDNLDLEDLDSILDDCLALGMPSTHLQWHYRSRHESLIAFSNNEFYESSMLTFPSVNDREKHVKLIKVDGFFSRNKGRVNEAEAVAIVGEIKRRYKDTGLRNQSIGVVTFNISQQTLIEDLLQDEFVKDLDFDAWANNCDETLFVKNLENVQGDERDVILFSVAFGPDEDGKLLMNFGPLNKDGGWKRLNVAVSRARCDMIVFSTMTSDMIDLKRTKSKGVEALKDFLEFAQKGKIQNDYSNSYDSKYHGIMDEICKGLDKAGYRYQKEVGHSKFKVDIAVINPYNEDEYLLGIMLDGESYHQSANTRDREVAQITVLHRLGWKLHRIWTMDWWDDKQREMDKLMKLLDEMRVEAEQQGSYGQDVVVMTEKEHQMIADMPVTDLSSTINNEIIGEYKIEKYVEAQLEMTSLATSDYILKSNMAIIAAKLQEIIDVEAPILQDKLIKKCLRAFDIGRSSVVTLEATQKAMKKVRAKSNKQNGIKFYWREDQNPDNYYIYRNDTTNEERRLPDEICQQELKNAVCVALSNGKVLRKEVLIKETIKIMGFSRSGSALVDAVERGIKYGLKTGELVRDVDKTIRYCSTKYNAELDQ